MGRRRVLLAAHGTRSATGRACVEEIRAALAARLGEEVVLGWVDVVEPFVADIVRPGDVVVPCFLGAGYHVRHDIPAAVEGIDDVTVTAHLGPGRGVAEALMERVAAAGGPWPVTLLGWAGSSDERSRAQCRQMADVLRVLWRGEGKDVEVHPVTPGAACAALDQALADAEGARGPGAQPVGIATYLLAPGHFADQLAGLGVPASRALGAHPALVEELARRLAH